MEDRQPPNKQSLDIKAEKMQKALGTFKRFQSEETAKGRELIRGTESRSQDSIKINQKKSKKAGGRPRKVMNTVSSKTDAAENEAASTASTRSHRNRIEHFFYL